MSAFVTDLVVIAAVLAIAVALVRPKVRTSRRWRATVTPLASIIGSGFLVVTPLLASVVGSWAPLAMAAIILLAYWVGSAMRFVIVDIEPLLAERFPSRTLLDLDRLSRLLLGFAYVISVAFYIRLMAAFVLRSADNGEVAAQLVATAVLGAIGAMGWARGLHGLETLEETAVGAKLAIIGGLLAGFVAFDLAHPADVVSAFREGGGGSDAWETLRMLAGMLLVVQGFETSRYLGAHYDARTRVTSMRRAQLLSAAIYVVFVSLSVSFFDALPASVDETAILDVAAEVTPILVPLLVVAAVASQLSAAVADTAGGGEMLTGSSRMLPTAGVGYVAVTSSAIAVVWLADVFAIITLASRSFAAYYFIQVAMVLLVLLRNTALPRRRVRLASFGSLLMVLGFVVVFAIPSGG